MKEVFKYSRFYILQPVLGMVFVAVIYCVLLGYRRKDVEHDWIVLIGFFAFVIFVVWKGVATLRKRLCDPVSIDVDDTGIKAIHRDGKITQIALKDVAAIETNKDRWRPGFETFRITSSVDGVFIECNNQLNKYNLLKATITEHVRDVRAREGRW